MPSKPKPVPAIDITTLPWVRTSERLTFNQCPQKWHWAYVERWRTHTPSPALRFGSLIHEALEAFYLPGIKRGPAPAQTFEQLFDAEERAAWDTYGFRDEDGEWHEAKGLGIAMLEAYVERFGKDNEWKVIATEQAFHQPVFSPKTGKPAFVYVGVVDGLWLRRSDKTLWVVDHKTTRDDPSKKSDALMLDEQAGAYWTYGVDALKAKGLIPKGAELSGMMYNFLRKGKPDTRPKNAAGQALNKDGSVSKQQPPPLFHREPVFRDERDGEMVRRRIWLQWMRIKALTKNPNRVYKIPGTLHNPHCGWCEFKDVCELHEMQSDYEPLLKTGFVKHDPYDQHAIEDGEKR